MEQEQEQKKLKISIFDVIIAAIVLIAAAAVIFMLKPGDSETLVSAATPMQYTVELAQMPGGSADLIQPGDAVKDGIKNYAIGTVVSAETRPFTVPATDESTGVVKNAPLDGYENILLTIQVKMNTSGTMLATESGYTLTVGTQVSVSGPCYAGTGYVTAIERSAE